MKLARPLFWLAIIANAIISYVMFKHGWNGLGGFMAVMTFIGIVNYLHIEYQNREQIDPSPQARSRRAAYFNSLSKEEQKEYLDSIERRLELYNEENSKNDNHGILH